MAEGEPPVEGSTCCSSSQPDAEQPPHATHDVHFGRFEHGKLRDLYMESPSQRDEARVLRKMLSQSEDERAHLRKQFLLLRNKYDILKATMQETFFELLPKVSPEFRPLCVQTGACSAVEFESDSRIDQIEVEYLGQGRFGTVFRGQTQRPDGSTTSVAVKSVAKAKVRSLTSLRNLANEIACMRHLTDVTAAPGSAEAMELEHVVMMKSVRLSSSRVYIEQSFGGSDLFSLVSRCSRDRTPLPTVVVANIARGIAMGLAAMHRQKWCHRDIKPENVLLGATTRQLLSALKANDAAAAAAQLHVRLCDFGVCAPLNGPPLRQFCGSPGFFAPELADAARGEVSAMSAPPPSDVCSLDSQDSAHTSGRSYDGAAADVFSLGATLLEMLIGTERFNAAWASTYRNYAVRNRSDMERTLVVARRDLQAALQSSNAEDSTAALGLGVVGQGALLNTLVFECLTLDPLERPKIDSIISATRPFCPSPPVVATTHRSFGNGPLPRRRCYASSEVEGGIPPIASRPRGEEPRGGDVWATPSETTEPRGVYDGAWSALSTMANPDAAGGLPAPLGAARLPLPSVPPTVHSAAVRIKTKPA